MIKISLNDVNQYNSFCECFRLLGNWEEAVKDLRLACKIDYDDQANDWLKEVTPNVSAAAALLIFYETCIPGFSHHTLSLLHGRYGGITLNALVHNSRITFG